MNIWYCPVFALSVFIVLPASTGPATAETPSAETSEASATSAERTEIAAATAETSEKYERDSSTSMATCGIPFFSSEKQRQEK